MKRRHARTAILIIFGILFIGTIGLADGAPAPLGIIPTPTPSPLSVSIWTDKTSYMIGENVTIMFNVTQQAYVYIYDIQPDGIVRLIFPNAYSQNNFVGPGVHTLPDGLYKFTVAPPTGIEHFQIFASPVSLGLSPPYFGEPFPMVGSDPGSARSKIRAHIMGIVPEPDWATAWTSFTIVGGYGYGYAPPSYYHPYPPFCPPFFGYPGVTWYWSDGEWRFGTPPSGWYWYFGPDCKWHLRITIRFGTGD